MPSRAGAAFQEFSATRIRRASGRGPSPADYFSATKPQGISDTSKFPVSQDQRNTVRARVRFQATERLWFATSAEYGSGLPVDLNGPVDPSQIAFLLQQYGSAILNEVNFNAGRVRPNFSLDAAAGATLFHKEGKDITFEIEGNNLTNKVNVMNFASLFSGTAVAPPASVSARLKFGFNPGTPISRLAFRKAPTAGEFGVPGSRRRTALAHI